MTRAMDERRREGPWSVPVTVREVPVTGRRFVLEPDEATRTAIAKSAALRALPRLQATFDVTRHGSAGLHVAGRVGATVGQVCGVTLDPIDNEVEETIDLIFIPGVIRPVADPNARETVEVTGDDPPEPLRNDTVDLGAIATEFLILGIDPFPRKPDAEFQPPAIDDKTEHPFAALATLRNGPGGRDE